MFLSCLKVSLMSYILQDEAYTSLKINFKLMKVFKTFHDLPLLFFFLSLNTLCPFSTSARASAILNCVTSVYAMLFCTSVPLYMLFSLLAISPPILINHPSKVRLSFYPLCSGFPDPFSLTGLVAFLLCFHIFLSNIAGNVLYNINLFISS